MTPIDVRGLTVYVDSSFLVSLYSLDVNSKAAVALAYRSTAPFLLSRLVELEVVNAFGLRVFRKELSPEVARLLQNGFQADLRANTFQRKPLSDNVFAEARRLSQETTPSLGTRTSDLLHVAAALELGAEGFYSFDRKQRTLAEAVKLKTNSMP